MNFTHLVGNTPMIRIRYRPVSYTHLTLPTKIAV